MTQDKGERPGSSIRYKLYSRTIFTGVQISRFRGITLNLFAVSKARRSGLPPLPYCATESTWSMVAEFGGYPFLFSKPPYIVNW